MAVYDLEEQEQIAALRGWWKQYGGWAIGVLLIIAFGCLGWYGWQSYQKSQNAEASRIFLVLQQASAQQDTSRVKQAAGELVNQYPRSQFSSLGALLAATTLQTAGDAKSAEAQLNWVADNGKEALRGVARLRLAGMQLDQNDFDGALKTLSETPPPGFAARYDAARGDVYAAQGKITEARASYDAALKNLEVTGKDVTANSEFAGSEPGQLLRRLVQEKRDALTVASAGK
ncbi:MAG: YfgM family protein [Fluviibacter sp.]|jgi:predicted negative regulator of RcsB-dependent stress response